MAELTTDAGAANANAYTTEAAADLLLGEHRLHTDEWAAASTLEKRAAIIWATALLDDAMDWFGALASYTQALGWPRVGVATPEGRIIDHTTIPQKIAEATAALAWELVKSDRLQDPELIGKGIEELQIDVIRIKVKSIDKTDFIPHYIVVMLSDYGRPKPIVGQGFRFVPVRRT